MLYGQSRWLMGSSEFQSEFPMPAPAQPGMRQVDSEYKSINYFDHMLHPIFMCFNFHF